MSFEALGLSAPILKALKACGYAKPTPIQKKAIPSALQGRDVLGCAQTGTGKTCAFGTPILQRLAEKPGDGRKLRALIVTPTRELAIQIGENLTDYSKYLPLKSTVIFGGVGQAPQVELLKKGVDVLTATPGRLLDLHQQGLINLKDIEIFVLDEADRMLDMGFINDVRKIVALLPKEKQTLFFSATMPDEITDLVNSLMKNPVRVEVDPVSSPVEVIRQQVYLVDRKNKTKLLAKIIREESVKNALVFTRTKHGADKVTRELVKEGVVASAIHGNKSQTARQQALSLFKKGKVQVLVATDIAARGLDIEELSHVFNYNLPEVPETYIHRIGRTGRAGHGGTAISFCDFTEQSMLRSIEALLGKAIPRIDSHPWPMEVFEQPQRDAKGRLVNPDDQEARQAARERRQNGQGKAKNGKTAPAPQEKPSASARQEKKPLRPKPQRAPLETRLNQPVADITDVSEVIVPRKSPLEGDRIMDATARLFAAKPSRQFSQPEKKKGGENQNRNAQKSKQQGENKKNSPNSGQKNAPQKGETSGNRRQRRRPEAPGAAAKEVENRQRKSGAPIPAKGKEQKVPGSGTGNRNRGRRTPPPVEGPRSNQKDSTEQPSLMKPFYIDHD